MALLTIQQYAEKYGISVTTVRGWTKQEKPPFEVKFSGNKAYIKDEDVSSDNTIKVDTLEEIKKTQEMVVYLCKHFGLDVEKMINNG